MRNFIHSLHKWVWHQQGAQIYSPGKAGGGCGLRILNLFAIYHLPDSLYGKALSHLCSERRGTERFWGTIAILLMVLLFGFTPSAYAHGTEIDLSEAEAIQIHARFDNGDPMSNAQVYIYAPTDRTKPWLTGEANVDGYFVFVPDRTMGGTWDVQVRTAGHGDWGYIDIAEGAVISLAASSSGMTIAQIVMMSAAIIWGFVGTAFYFLRPKGDNQVGNGNRHL